MATRMERFPDGGNISPEVLDELEKTRPDLVAQYREKLAKSNKEVEAAEDIQDYGSIANTAGKIFTDFSNSNKRDAILHNRMDRLGSTPTIKQAEEDTYDDSVINNITSRNLGRAKQGRDQAKEDFWTEQKLQDRERDLSYKDSSSDKSRTYQNILKNMLPTVAEQLGDNLNNLSAEDLEKNFPKLAQIFYDKGGKGSGKASDWQVLSLAGPNGTTRYVNYNKLTGEQREIDGTKGYAPRFVKDPYTGMWKQLSPGSAGGQEATPAGNYSQPSEGSKGSSSAPSAAGGKASKGPLPGESPNEYNRRRDLEQEQAKKEIQDQQKRQEALVDAQAMKATRSKTMNDFISLYDGASKEKQLFMDGVGPIDGRISKLKNDLGFSHGENTDKLISRTESALADYIKEISGAAASDKEVARLKKVMPSVSDERQLFINKLRAALDEADKIVSEKLSKAGVTDSSSKPKTIIQNGHTYTLNEETGEYE